MAKMPLAFSSYGHISTCYLALHCWLWKLSQDRVLFWLASVMAQETVYFRKPSLTCLNRDFKYSYQLILSLNDFMQIYFNEFKDDAQTPLLYTFETQSRSQHRKWHCSPNFCLF